MLSDNSKICSTPRPSVRLDMAFRALVPATALLLAAGLALQCGCASQVSRREAAGGYGSAAESGQGGSWEAVFATPDVADRMVYEDPQQLPEFARADTRLSEVGDGPITAGAEWPEPDRASLEYPRYLQVRDRDGRYTYFGTRPTYYRRYFNPGWYPAP